MTFTKLFPGGVPANATLTSAEIQTFDTNLSNALDKTPAGDTISGPILIGSSGNLTLTADAFIDLLAGSFVDIESGAVVTVKTGGTLRYQSGYPSFSTARTRSVVYSTASLPLAGGVNAGLLGVITSITGQVLGFSIPGHDGATLASVDVIFAVDNGHVGLPGTPPAMSVQRVSYVVGSAASPESLYTLGGAVYTPLSLANYNNGFLKKMTLTCDQHNVIDRSTYAYNVIVVHESGTDSIAAGNYLALILNFSAISDLRFP